MVQVNSFSKTRNNGFHKKEWFAIGILTLLVFLVFGRCIYFDYTHYDDSVIVFENPIIQAGLSIENICYVFTHRFEDLYQPLPAITLMVDKSLWGDRISGFFVSNIVWHLLCTCTFFWVMLRIINSFRIAFFASLLFCVHPVQAMIIHSAHLRNETMSAFFILLSIKMYWNYAVTKAEECSENNANYVSCLSKKRLLGKLKLFMHPKVLSLLFMFLSILCKQVSIMVPCILLLLDYWPLKRISLMPADFRKKRTNFYVTILEKWPWLILSCIGTLGAYFGKYNAMEEFSKEIPIHLSTLSVVLTAYMRYIWHLIFPFHHRYVWMVDWSPAPWIIWVSGMLLALITSICLVNLRKRPWLIFCWGWFVLFLFPLTGVVRFSMEHIALRYLYLPSMGFFLLVSFIAHDVIIYYAEKRISGIRTWILHLAIIVSLYTRRYAKKIKSAHIYWSFVVLAIIISSMSAYWQSGFWRNSEVLATRALDLTDGNDFVAVLILKMLQKKNISFDQLYQPVFPDFDNVPSCNKWAERHAFVLLGFKQYEEALQYMSGLDSDSSTVRAACGGALLGKALDVLESSQNDLEFAVKMNPDDGYSHYNLALCSFLLGDFEKAEVHIKRASELLPTNDKMKELMKLLEKELEHSCPK